MAGHAKKSSVIIYTEHLETKEDYDGLQHSDVNQENWPLNGGAPPSQHPATASATFTIPTSLSFYKSLLRNVARSVGLFLLPSFICERFFPRGAASASRHGGVAALDGLRGLACLFVFNEHVSYNITRAFLVPYGTDDTYHLIQLPFIRLAWSGFSMVSIFFVISGYVLSYKPLKQMQARDMQGFNKTITSSIIRRGLRLYLPTTAAILITGFLAWLGIFESGQKVWDDMPEMILHELPPPRADILPYQLWDAWLHAWPMFRDVWHWSDDSSAGPYDMHLWTIPVEFRTSMILFLTLVGLCRLRHRFRLLTEISLCVFAIYSGRRDVWMFTGGCLLADLDLLRKRRVANSISLDSKPSPVGRSWGSPTFRAEAFWIVVFVFGTFCLSVSAMASEEQYGFHYLLHMASYLWGLAPMESVKVIGAIYTVWAVANGTTVQPLFTNAVAQYLGKISYALYIVHGDVLCALQYAILPHLWAIVGVSVPNDATPAQCAGVWAMSLLCVLPTTIWVADLFTRAVDNPSVRFARWVESKIICQGG